MKKALVIGYGSIGQRHERLLSDMGFDVKVVSRHLRDGSHFYNTVEQAFKEHRFEYVVIANETSAHREALKQVNAQGFTGSLLVEKPLFMHKEEDSFNSFHHNNTFVAYNLRFHPLIVKLKEMLLHARILSVNCYVGQYLPTWRPDTDYTKSYSASINKGGGVLRDLSHELDYLMYLFGEWQSLVASKVKISKLNIETEDYVNIHYVTQSSTRVSVELNYLDRITQRYVIVQTDQYTIKADFIANTISCNDKIEKLQDIDRDYTYIKQHESVLNGDSVCCSYSQGNKVVEMIEAIEKSSYQRGWIDHA